ncbi:MAG: penicillin-binding transpeptidase domain-containing protein [Bacteroidota bacterium]
MNNDIKKYVIYIFIIVVGVIYTVRLFYMQVIDDSWTIRAGEIAEKRREIIPPRGAIIDRNGRKIVANSTYFNLMMVEKNIKNLDTAAFAKLIGWTREEVRARFKEIVEGEGVYRNKSTGKKTPNYQKIRAYPFLKELTLNEISKIAPHLENFPGFYEEVTSMRNYPYPIGANILGYLAEVNPNEIDKDSTHFYRPGSNIGKAGLERFYEKELRGTKGIKYIVTSALNNAIEPYANGKYDTAAVQGPMLKLGVDILLQEYGEKLMKNKRGCIVAIEPESGEILAMISAPMYDPNLLIGKRNIAANYPSLVTDKNKPLLPRPLASMYAPGSIFKLLNSLIGLQEGVITPEFGAACNKSVVGCHDHASAGNLMDGIKHSCNPYFYAVTRKILQQGKKKSVFEDAEIGLNIWAEYMHRFGLGQKLATDITGVKAGLIPDSKFYDKWYGYHRWAFSTIRSISIGQGEVLMTPLQMANVAAVIANRGWYITPHFVKSIGKKGPLDIYKEKHESNIDKKHYDVVVEGMRRVVYEPGGTGRRCRLKEITIGGKTGTVQNSHGDDHSVFIAFAPIDKPKIAIAVFIENAKGGGGLWACPTAGLMIEKYLTGKITEVEREKTILDANFLNK